MVLQFFPPDEQRLRQHLISQLATMCDADPEALADYVLALLKHHDKPVEELRSFCASQLVEFLHESTQRGSLIILLLIIETNAFLDDIFHQLSTMPKGSHIIPNTPIAISNTRAVGVYDHKDEANEDEEEEEDEVEAEYHRGRHHRRDRERSPDDRHHSRERDHGQRQPYDSDRQRTRRPHICHQFASRGFCHRGNACPYDHTPPTLLPPPPPPPHLLFPMLQPHEAAMIAAAAAANGGSPILYNQHHRRRYTSTAAAQTSTSRPAPSSTRLILDKIPPDFCSVAKIDEYFGKFGTLVNLSLQADQHRALLQYAKPEEALAAFRSPEVIFNNRFVKLYWDASDTMAPVGGKYRGDQRPQQWRGPKQREDQPREEESPAALKKQEVLRSMHELQKQKQDLLQKYIQQQKDLLQRLEAGNMEETVRQDLLASLKSIDSVIGSIQLSIQAKPTSPMAVDTLPVPTTSTPAPATDEPSSKTGPILRGGPAYYRGGAAWRGRGGATSLRPPPTQRPIQSYRLDLRPTSLCLNPIPSQVGCDLGSLRKFFEPYGEIRSLVLGEDGRSAIVTYANRHVAEKAHHYISKVEIGEPIKIDWYQQQQQSKPIINPSSEDHHHRHPSSTKALLLDDEEMGDDGDGGVVGSPTATGDGEERSWKR